MNASRLHSDERAGREGCCCGRPGGRRPRFWPTRLIGLRGEEAWPFPFPWTDEFVSPSACSRVTEIISLDLSAAPPPRSVRSVSPSAILPVATMMEATSDAADDRATAGSMALRRKRPSTRPSSMETQAVATETEEGQQSKGWLRSRRRPGKQKYALILATVLVVSTTIMGVVLRATENDTLNLNARMSDVKQSEFNRVSAQLRERSTMDEIKKSLRCMKVDDDR